MIRRAGPDDLRPLAELWTRAFPSERTVEQRLRHLETGGTFGGAETAWLIQRGGRVAGAFRAYALTQHMHGTTYPMMGLAAVAVDETARRRGIGRELCIGAINLARERGDLLSVLYPFRPSFYTALGWGYVGELHVYRFRPETLVLTGDAPVRRAGSDDVNGIGTSYARVAAETNGMIARTPRIWRQHLEGDDVHVYVTGESRVAGYLIARVGRSASPDERLLLLQELIATDAAAYRALLGWVAAQRDSIRVVQYDAAPDEHFAHRLAEPRPPGFRSARFLWAPVARVIRGPMLRMLDVRGALERRVRWAPSAPLRFGLHIVDDVVAENAGDFVLDFDGSSVSVARGRARPALHTRIETFSQIFAGELSVQHALTMGAAEADGDVGAVHALFRTDRCFRLLDEF